MSIVSDILRTKGDSVLTIGVDATILDAARTMNLHKIGALVVTDMSDELPRSGADHGVLGIITERDILTRIVAAEADPRTTTVGKVMTSPIITCGPDTSLDEVRQVMRRKRIRHMPVLSTHGLCGILSIGDLNNAQHQIMEETIRYLEIYMYHG